MNHYLAIGIAIVVVLLTIYIICKFSSKCQLLNEILKEQDKDKSWRYSQGRVYLLVAILSYYTTVGLMTGKALKPNMDLDLKTLETIINALQWAMGLFAGYVFGGKGLDVLKFIMKKDTPSVTNEQEKNNNVAQ